MVAINMASNTPAVLSIAARSGRIAYVFFDGSELKAWSTSRKGSKNARTASAVVGGWIAEFVPDIIIVEDYRTATRKGRNTKAIIRAIENVAKNTSAGICVVDRKQMFKNNIDEARQFAKQYPELKAWVPDRPKLWESEPRNIIYFEALALAKQVLGVGSE
jgi:hypothetical protein